MKRPFELVLFAIDPQFIHVAAEAGVATFLVDWENLGKDKRQAVADTQINRDSLEDLRRVRAATDANVICRLNSCGGHTAEEVEQALSAGADEILLPMVRTVEEVERVIHLVGGRCGVGILIETVSALERVSQLGELPLSRAYVGLNDLAIERNTPHNIFLSLLKGTVERIRRAFNSPFGFGGLTLPSGGHPVPCRLLIGEMARLDCDFSFLRRSFYRDIVGHDPCVEIPRLRKAIEQARARSAAEVAKDKLELEKAILLLEKDRGRDESEW